MMKLILWERDSTFFNFIFSKRYTNTCVPHVWLIWVAALQVVLFATH